VFLDDLLPTGAVRPGWTCARSPGGPGCSYRRAAELFAHATAPLAGRVDRIHDATTAYDQAIALAATRPSATTSAVADTISPTRADLPARRRPGPRQRVWLIRTDPRQLLQRGGPLVRLGLGPPEGFGNHVACDLSLPGLVRR
jgi:hypothetical protein